MVIFGLADVNQPDSNGITPLMKAAALGRYEMIKYLIEHGAIITTIGPGAKTAIDKARLHDHTECVELLQNPTKSIKPLKRNITEKFEEH